MQSTARRNMTLLFIIQVLVMLGFGVVIPIMPFYTDHLGASATGLGLLMSIFAAAQLVFSPIWGQLSDRIGRKPVLIIGILGNALSMLMFGLSTQLWMLFASRALAGMLSSATMPTTMAYVGDTTTDEGRSAGMGLMGAAMGLGMVLGPGLGGAAAGVSLSLPFFIASGLSMLVVPFVYFMLPESLPAAARAPRRGKIQGLNVGLMWRSLGGPLGYLFFLAFLVNFALTNFEGVIGLYALRRFSYTSQQVGLVLTVVGLVTTVMQGLMTGPLSRRWGESRVIQISLAASAIAFPLMLVARDMPTIMLATGFFILCNALLRPAVSSLTSKRADQGQGVAQGLSNGFMSLGRIIGPLTAGFLLDRNLFLPYWAGGAIMLAGFMTTFIWLFGGRQPEVAVPAVE